MKRNGRATDRGNLIKMSDFEERFESAKGEVLRGTVKMWTDQENFRAYMQIGGTTIELRAEQAKMIGLDLIKMGERLVKSLKDIQDEQPSLIRGPVLHVSNIERPMSERIKEFNGS